MDAARVYRRLVRLYPRAFRDEYADDLVALFEDQCRDERPARVCLRAAVDLIMTVPVRHLEAPMPRRAPTTMMVLYSTIALCGVLTALLTRTNHALGVFALLVAIVAGALALATWRRHLASAPLRSAGAWWKLLGVGAFLVGSVVVGAGLGIDAWNLGFAMVVSGLILAAAGIVLGLVGLAGLVRRRSSLAG